MATYTEDQIKNMSYEQLLQLLRENAAVDREGQMLDGGRAAITVDGQPYNLEYMTGGPSAGAGAGNLRLWRETGTAANGDEINRGYQIAPDGTVVQPWQDYTTSDQTQHAINGLAGMAALVGGGALLANNAAAAGGGGALGATGASPGLLTGAAADEWMLAGLAQGGEAAAVSSALAAGYTPAQVATQMVAAGYTPAQMAAAGLSVDAIATATGMEASEVAAAVTQGSPAAGATTSAGGAPGYTGDVTGMGTPTAGGGTTTPAGGPGSTTNPSSSSAIPDWAKPLMSLLPVAGAAAAAADSGPETVTSVRDIPDWAKPYALEDLNRTQQVADRPFQQYEGDRVADWNEDQEAARVGVRRLATEGNPATNAGQAQQMRVLTGDFMKDPVMRQTTPTYTNPYMNKDNPYLQNAIDLSIGDVSRNFYNNTMPGVQSAFNQGGGNNFNSSARAYQEEQNREAAARVAANITSDYRMADYDKQIGMNEADINRRTSNFQIDANRNLDAYKWGNNLQQDAAQFSPQWQNAEIDRWRTLAASGGDYNAYTQRNLDADREMWDERWNYPYKQLEVYQSGRPVYGNSSQSSTTMPGVNPWLAAAGGAAAGMSMYGQGRTYGWW